MEHSIKLAWGLAENGGWPFAVCSCGWMVVSKDLDLVKEGITEHVDKFYASELD